MFLRAWLLTTTLALAPVVPALAEPAPATPPAATPESRASLAHSATKATTFKIGTTITNLGLLSFATGDLVGGLALSSFMLASSWVLYTANDYAWERYSPAPARDAGQAFDAGADAWRNTWKFVTYKPVIASVKLASLYAWTANPAVTAVFGTASILTNTVVFYANNMAWDWYDWYSGTAKPVPPQGPALAAR